MISRLRIFAQKYHDHLLLLIFFQALLAVLGSLYFSNYGDPVGNLQAGMFLHSLGGFIPCKLCWWARILMYPIAAISTIGLLTNDKTFAKYSLGLAIPGFLLEMYHYALQKGVLISFEQCTQGAPCDAMNVNYFGFITIPFLCLIAFGVIIIASSLSLLAQQKAS